MHVPLISVIVPIYNAEKHVANLVAQIESCRSSSLSAEFILVDDGSSDSSMRGLVASLKGFDLIKVLKKENGGVSSARNLGLQHAKGDYVIFLDVDDQMNWRAICSSFQAGMDSDITFFSYWFGGAGRKARAARFPSQNFKEVRLILRAVLDQSLQVHISSAVYKREFLEINALTFCEALSYGEDNEFIIRSLVAAREVMLRSDKILTYMFSPESAVNKAPDERRLDTLIAMKRAFNAVESGFQDLELRRIMRSRMALNYMNIVHDYYSKRAGPVASIDAALEGGGCRKALKAFRPRTSGGVIRFLAIRAYVLAPKVYIITAVPFLRVVRKW